MSYYWNFDVLYSDKSSNIAVVRASSNPGEVFANKYGIFGDYSDGVQWIDAGSEVKLLNGEGELDSTVIPYEKVDYSNPENYQNPVGIIVTIKPSNYYCINDPTNEVCWDGYIRKFPADVSETLLDMQGKRIYVAEGEVTVNGTLLKTGKMAHLSSTEEAVITSSVDSVIAVVHHRSLNDS